MALFEGMQTINAPMKKEHEEWITSIVYNGTVIKKVPTPKSQIRKDRISFLWTVGCEDDEPKTDKEN